MASEWSALEIENDLKRLLNISCGTNDAQNSSSPLDDPRDIPSKCPDQSNASDVHHDHEQQKRCEENGNDFVVGTSPKTSPNSIKAKKKIRKRKEKRNKKTSEPQSSIDAERSVAIDDDRIRSTAITAKPKIRVPPKTLLPTKMEVEEKSRADNRPNIVANGPTERLNVLKGDGDHRSADGAIRTSSIKEPDLSKFNLVKFDSCPNVPPPEEILNILKKEWIFPLKRKSSKHPRAHYLCRLCLYHCDDLVVCSKHIKGPKHVSTKEEYELNSTLEHIPLPSKAQSEVQSELLVAIVAQNGLQDVDVFRRKDTFKEIDEMLRETLPSGCELQMFGSSVTVLGLRECDLNINLEVKEESNLIPAIVLQKVYDFLLSRTNVFLKVEMDTSTNLPVITFLHRRTLIKCVIGLNNGACVKTTNLLAHYANFDGKVRILAIAFRFWAKLCRINDQQRGTLPPHTFDLMVIFYLQQCEPPILPVFHEHYSSCGAFDYDKLKESWKSENRQSVGHLWIEMLRFYALPFSRKDLVVCIRQSALLNTLKKNWRGRKLPVEDPFVNKRNLTRCVTSPKVYEFILMCLKLSFRYFGIPQLLSGPLFGLIVKPLDVNPNTNDNGENVKMKDEEDRSNVEPTRRTRQESYATDTSALSEEEDLLLAESLKDDDDDVDDVTTGRGEEDEESKIEKEPEPKIEKEIPRLPLPNDILEKFYSVGKDEMSYMFFWKVLTGGKVPIMECSLCKRQGHLKDNCPDEILPRIHPLPPMQPQFMMLLDCACCYIWKNFSPSHSELFDREEILRELQLFVRNIYPDARLELFGSFCNGFGFSQSDLDICLTFKNNKTGENLQFADITLNLAENLKKYKAVYQVIAIPTAKVPIVKCMHRNRNLECDISLYNTLGQHNTKMMFIYSEIDPRVKGLGYTMKYFAKTCAIGDASRGSLSSYAYILMVIYFLQQRKPPVVPVLQQLYDRNKPKPEEIVDGWNAWFFKDIQRLKTIWAPFGKNKETVGELWLGLLKFYTEEFNFKKHVISIKQIEPLSRFEKLWNKKTIAIEDPFNLNHNLGSGVSRKMNTYIRKAFIRGRVIFGTPLMFTPKGYRCVEDYLFDPRQLTDGPPPNDRCCRACGRIGHIVRDCPRKKGAKEQQAVEKKENVAVVKRNQSSEREKNIVVDRNFTSENTKNKIRPNENLKAMPDKPELLRNKVPSVQNSPKVFPQPLIPTVVSNSAAHVANYMALGLDPILQADSIPCNQIGAQKQNRTVQAIERPTNRSQQQQQQQQQQPICRPPPGFTNVLSIEKQLQLQNLLMEKDNIARQMAADRVSQCRENVLLPHNFSNECPLTAPPVSQSFVRYISPFATTEENVCPQDLTKSNQALASQLAALQQMRAAAAGLPIFANTQNVTRHFIPPFIPNTQRFPAPNMVAFGTVVEPVPSAGFKCNQDLNS